MVDSASALFPILYRPKPAEDNRGGRNSALARPAKRRLGQDLCGRNGATGECLRGRWCCPCCDSGKTLRRFYRPL